MHGGLLTFLPLNERMPSALHSAFESSLSFQSGRSHGSEGIAVFFKKKIHSKNVQN